MRRQFGVSKQAIRLAAERIASWNRLFPVGTEVILSDDDGKEYRTRTRLKARLLRDEVTAVVPLEGREGAYLLQRVRPVTGELRL